MQIKKSRLAPSISKIISGNESNFNGEISGDFELDIEISDTYTKTVMSLVESEDIGIILDLSNVTYIDSTGIWALFEISKHISNIEKILCITNPQKDVRRVLEITKMDTKLKVCTDDQEAISYFELLKNSIPKVFE